MGSIFTYLSFYDSLYTYLENFMPKQMNLMVLMRPGKEVLENAFLVGVRSWGLVVLLVSSCNDAFAFYCFLCLLKSMPNATTGKYIMISYAHTLYIFFLIYLFYFNLRGGKSECWKLIKVSLRMVFLRYFNLVLVSYGEHFMFFILVDLFVVLAYVCVYISLPSFDWLELINLCIEISICRKSQLVYLPLCLSWSCCIEFPPPLFTFMVPGGVYLLVL